MKMCLTNCVRAFSRFCTMVPSYGPPISVSKSFLFAFGSLWQPKARNTGVFCVCLTFTGTGHSLFPARNQNTHSDILRWEISNFTGIMLLSPSELSLPSCVCLSTVSFRHFGIIPSGNISLMYFTTYIEKNKIGSVRYNHMKQLPIYRCLTCFQDAGMMHHHVPEIRPKKTS